MLILAIDTALASVSACIYDTEAQAVLASGRVLLERGHAEALVPLLERLAEDVPGGLEAIARVAVTVGPGSFTGIRVGVSAARAIALACDAEIVGVSTLSAFAAPLIGAGAGRIASVIDARHGNMYFELFDENGSVVQEACVLPVARAATLLGGEPTLLAGPGASLLAIEAWSQGRKAEVAGETISPDISFVAMLAALADPADAPADPVYLKPADVTVAPAGILITST
jgi:tRNA threonylcarbamoyl adenosine modification protein YeaZ